MVRFAWIVPQLPPFAMYDFDQPLHTVSQACKFQVGSYSYDITKMSFAQSNKVQGWVQILIITVLMFGVIG